MIWNALNFPAGVLPVTVVKPEEQNYATDKVNDLVHKAILENMKTSAGLPVSVQIVSYPFQEERCLSLMKQIEEKVKFREQH